MWDHLTLVDLYLKKNNLLTFPSLYILEAGLVVKKHPEIFEKLNNSELKLTRDPTRLKFPKCKTALMQKNCHCMVIKIFNKIPRDIRELPIKYFRKKLITWLLEKTFYNIEDFF